MKLLLLFAFSLLVHSGLSQTVVDETTGSGMTPVDPCEGVECPSDSTCVKNGDCECNTGFIIKDKDNKNCIRGCKSMVIQVNNIVVKKDFVNCSHSSYELENTTITVFFEDAYVGSYASANVSCNITCNSKPRAIGAMKCESSDKWEAPLWTDCSAGDADQSPAENLQDSLISTSNTEEIKQDDVQNAVEAIEDVTAGDTLPEENADAAIETINNLLQATDGNAIQEVQSSGEKILDSIVKIGTTVALNTPGTGYGFFRNILSNIALYVVGSLTTAAKAYPEDEYFFSSAMSSSNLADSGVMLTTIEQSGSSYIRAKPTSEDGRILFQLYSETGNLFTDLAGTVVDGVIFAISGNAVDEFTIKFKINLNITVTTGSNYFEQDGETFRLRAMRYNANTTTWVPAEDNECYSYSADDKGFATVKCNVIGQYSMKMESTTRPVPTEDGGGDLSGGAIAGIVIGSLVGVALIVGIIVYCKKKSKKTSVADKGY